MVKTQAERRASLQAIRERRSRLPDALAASLEAYRRSRRAEVVIGGDGLDFRYRAYPDKPLPEGRRSRLGDIVRLSRVEGVFVAGGREVGYASFRELEPGLCAYPDEFWWACDSHSQELAECAETILRNWDLDALEGSGVLVEFASLWLEPGAARCAEP